MQTTIEPVDVYPGTANTLYLRAGNLGPPPSYYYELQDVQTDDEGVVTTTILKNGNVNMTEEQWDDWAAGPIAEDEPYQLSCIAANLGLTEISPSL